MSKTGRLNLVCVDDSEYCMNGFEWYLKNHHRKGDTLGLVHVQEVVTFPSYGLVGGGPQLYDIYKTEVDKVVQKATGIKAKFEKLCRDHGVKFKFYLCGDHKPGQGICKLATDEDAAAIIVGQRGLGTISRALIGSTSDYVLHHANVPVIVVPKPHQ